MSHNDTYPITIAGIHRDLQKFKVNDTTTIAILNILGDTELVNAAAHELATLIKERNPDALVTAEAKSIPLAHALSTVMDHLPYVVLRKTYKPYMGDALKSETLSITTGQPQTLYLDEKDRHFIKGKRVIILDDVISTGSTLQGMQKIMGEAEAIVVGQSAILTEGDEAQWQDIIALGHLPVWIDH